MAETEWIYVMVKGIEIEKNIQRMSEMEEVLQFILESLDKEVSQEEVAVYSNHSSTYFTKIFRQYFECSFSKYINQLKMRRVANRLLMEQTVKDIWQISGYSKLSNFSKAFNKEFNMSPKKFLKTMDAVPDMPERKFLFGNEIHLSYEETNGVTVTGYPIPLKNGNNTDLMEEVAYALNHSEGLANLDLKCDEEHYGIWWHNKYGRCHYLWAKKGDNCSLGSASVMITGGHYAVFSFKRKENHKETAKISRMLARYIFKEWKFINNKSLDTMGFTYEKFDKERAYIYVPILKQEIGGERQNIDKWITYIDNHIKENLAIKNIAQTMHYSEKSFREVFQMYYNMSPSVYILRRRLCLVAGQIQQHPRKETKILEKYLFKSKVDFEKHFIQEFGVSYNEYDKISFEVVDLKQYHKEYKELLEVKFQTIQEIMAMVKPIKKPQIKEEEINIPGLAAYWFKHKMKNFEQEIVDKVALWDLVYGENAEDTRYEYVLGPVLSEKQSVSTSLKVVSIESGKYAIFKTKNKSDLKELEEIFRMMTRCVFYGWTKENRERLDIERITFVRFYDEKLYFYVPVNW